MIKSFNEYILNENAEMMKHRMFHNDISIEKIDMTYSKRVGIIPEYFYLAYYKKDILIAYGKQMHFLYKEINEFIKTCKTKLDVLLKINLSIVKEFDKNANLTTEHNNFGMLSYDRFRFKHRYTKFNAIEVDIATIHFRYEDYICSIEIKSKNTFKSITYDLSSYNIKNKSSIKQDNIDMSTLKSLLKLLKYHTIGVFDDDDDNN